MTEPLCCFICRWDAALCPTPDACRSELELADRINDEPPQGELPL
jgi:hypothetical protein